MECDLGYLIILFLSWATLSFSAASIDSTTTVAGKESTTQAARPNTPQVLKERQVREQAHSRLAQIIGKSMAQRGWMLWQNEDGERCLKKKADRLSQNLLFGAFSYEEVALRVPILLGILSFDNDHKPFSCDELLGRIIKVLILSGYPVDYVACAIGKSWDSLVHQIWSCWAQNYKKTGTTEHPS